MMDELGIWGHAPFIRSETSNHFAPSGFLIPKYSFTHSTSSGVTGASRASRELLSFKTNSHVYHNRADPGRLLRLGRQVGCDYNGGRDYVAIGVRSGPADTEHAEPMPSRR